MTRFVSRCPWEGQGVEMEMECQRFTWVGNMHRVVGRERGDDGFVDLSNIRSVLCYREFVGEIDVWAGEFVSYMAISYSKTG